jgi:hypothetical protein
VSRFLTLLAHPLQAAGLKPSTTPKSPFMSWDWSGRSSATPARRSVSARPDHTQDVLLYLAYCPVWRAVLSSPQVPFLGRTSMAPD